MRIYLTIFIAIVLSFSLTLADYHYASHDGSNEFPYTNWETGARRIQEAVDAAEPGDTIYVGEGTWPDTVEIWTNSLALIGTGMGNTILENVYETQITFYADTLLVEEFSFVSNWVDFVLHSGISVLNLGYVNFKNNYFYGNNAAVSGNMTGIIHNNLLELNRGGFRTTRIRDTLVIANNTVINSGPGSTFHCDDLHSDTSIFIIRNNLFYAGRQANVFYSGISFFGPDSAYIYNNVAYKKIDVSGAQSSNFGLSGQQIRYFNNTIDGRSENIAYSTIMGVRSNIWGDDSLSYVDNNIVSHCEIGFYNTRVPPVKVRYCDLFNIETMFQGEGELLEGNIFDDPMFMDTLDFHLQMFSPAIDAGNPDILDLDGTRSDIGAYGGPGSENYEYFDLPPLTPDSLNAIASASFDTIYIDWRYNTESDFNLYQLHRDTLSGFTPTIMNLISEPDTSYFVDTDIDQAHNFYYKISAIDNQDNMSDYSNELAVVFTGLDDPFDPNMPRSTVLYQNYPNPFNQNTIIKYYLPDIGYQPAQVQLIIYDLLGRQVRVLVDKDQYPGEYTVNWDGSNQGGRALPSGVYFYRLFLTGAELASAKKLMLTR